MLTILFWVLGTINGLLGILNLMVAASDDPSGRGMVQMFLIPFTIFVGMISLIIIGFAT